MTPEEFAKRCIEDYDSYTCDKCSFAVEVEETYSISHGFNGERVETNIVCTFFSTTEDKFYRPPKQTCGGWEAK